MLPLLAAVPDQLGDALLEAAPLLLVARPLHRRQVALHFTILVAIDLLQRALILLPLAHQLLHPILVRGLRRELGVERLVDLTLARADRLALLFEALLRRVQLAGLIVAQRQGGAHVLRPALPDLRAQLPRLGLVGGRRATGIRYPGRQRGREREPQRENPVEPFHQPSRDASSVRSCWGVRSSRPTSCAGTGSRAPGWSSELSTSRSWAGDNSPRSMVSTWGATPLARG